jgi:hypothetical protein
MTIPKCKSCKKPFKDGDDIVVTDANWSEPVHEECHHGYLLSLHSNYTMDLKEFIENIKED